MKYQRFLLVSLVGGMALSAMMPIGAQAAVQREPEAKVFVASSEGDKPAVSFLAYTQSFTGGGSVAVADLGGDSINEIITGAGPTGDAHVRVFRKDGSYVHGFFAYPVGMRSGVQVASGDLTGDGKAEIVTAPRRGAGPQVRVFNGRGEPTLTAGFFAYDQSFHGGVNIAVGDLTGDGKAEIVTAPGVGGSPHVRVFAGDGRWLGNDFWPFAMEHRGGVSVAIGNVDGGSESEIITAVLSGGEAWIKVYKYNAERTILGEWKAYDSNFTGGVTVASADVDGDGFDEVVVGVQSQGGPQVRMFKAHGEEIRPGFFAYEESYRGGVQVAAGNVDASGQAEIITMPNQPVGDGDTSVERYVRVDLSEQRLYAYERGILVNSFLISSGLPATPTPIGTFHIQRKIYSKLYSGPDYYLPNTLYNMQFFPMYYLHGAYWHNNFGHPMSHGCINIHYNDAAWIYEWIQDGDTVIIER